MNTVPDPDERYGLHWHGKRHAQALAEAPPTGTLVPCAGESIGDGNTPNMFIEADNLEALKLLKATHAAQVKLVYIDPPYNTGNSMVHADSFRESAREHMLRTGQANGRLHTAWLNMMYPRLLVARELLRPDGVIFVSIGDEELHNVRNLCELVFGEENYCGMFVWEKKKKPSFRDHNMGSVTEYIVAYARNRDLSPPFTAGPVQQGKRYPFNNAGNTPGTLTFPARSVHFAMPDQVVKAQDMSEGNIRTRLLDDVRIEDGTNTEAFRLEGEWRYSQATLEEFVAAGDEIVISKRPFRPNYVNRSGELKRTTNLLSYRVNGVPTNEDATQEMRETFGADVMSYPKPIRLLQYLIRSVTSEHDVVLDFFAGSGTTGVATLRQNAEDGSERAFVLVQNAEPLDASEKEQRQAAEFCQRLGRPANIAELAKERLRRETGCSLRVFRVASV